MIFTRRSKKDRVRSDNVREALPYIAAYRADGKATSQVITVRWVPQQAISGEGPLEEEPMKDQIKSEPEEGACQGEMTPPGQPCGERHYPAPPARRDTPPPTARPRHRGEPFDPYAWVRGDD